MLELTITGLPEPICASIPTPSVQWYHMGSLKIASVEIFTPWKLENGTNVVIPTPIPPESQLLNICQQIIRQ